MAEMLLRVEQLSVRFGGLAALSEVSFEMRPGIVKGLIGPNGAGKSTLFNAISGVTALSRGRITLGAQRIDAFRAERRARLGLARTFQNLQLFKELSVLENVMVGCHGSTRAGFLGSMLRTPAQRREEADIHARSMQALQRFGLAERAHRPAGELSFGEAKIVEMARAVVGRPTLLLLDEPVAGVPHEELTRVMAAIQEVNSSGVGVLLVEHNMRFVMGLCDELVVLDHGRKIADADASSVASDRAVQDAYLGQELADA